MYEPIRVASWQEFAEQMLADLGDVVAQRGSPTWLRVFEDPSTPVALCLSDSGPISLIGWTAPPECTAVGVVATGRAQALVGADDPGAIDRDFAQISLCCVVARTGEVGWTLEGSRGDRWISPPEEGKLLDTMMRCFGLPTPPPPAPASELHTAAWLTSILERAIEESRLLSWSEVSRLHPLAQLLGGELPETTDLTGVEIDDLGDLVRIAANAWSWAEIRAQARDGKLQALIDPSLAEWMDEGMLSRWLLGRMPPLDELFGVVSGYLAPSAVKRLKSFL